MLKRLLHKARQEAEKRLPEQVVDAGRKVRARVEQRIGHALGVSAPSLDREARVKQSVASARARMKDEEPAQVIIYATGVEAEEVSHLRAVFESKDEPVRLIDLDQDESGRTFRNISTSTGVMVPPYVFIAGRFWGARYDIEALDDEGDLDKILAGDLESISDGAKKIGRVRESFSDAMTLENIRERLGLGHSLCVDDIDTWLEHEDHEPVLFHQGGRITGEAVEQALAALVTRIDAGDVEAAWRVEPEVKVG